MVEPPATESSFAVIGWGGLGAFLILVEGIAQLAVGSSVLSIFGASAASAVDAFGVANVFFAILLTAFCLFYHRDPESGGGYGTAIVIVASLDLLFGGGFVIGSIFGVVGGILAIVFARLPRSRRGPGNDDAVGAEREPTEGVRSRATAGPSGVSPPSPEERVVRYCPHCWEVNDSQAATCSKCGASLPHPGPTDGREETA
jgi:hypothetical protein